MNYTVIISTQANKDLRGIYEYIALSLLSPENAVAQFSRLEERILNPDKMPKRYPKYKDNIRFMPVDNYLVFYSVNDDDKTVSILRVMFGRQDIENKYTIK